MGPFSIVILLLISTEAFAAIDPFCSIVAALTLSSFAAYSKWTCTTSGSVTSIPCGTPAWNGLVCSGGNVVSINFGSVGVSGIISRKRAIYLVTCN